MDRTEIVRLQLYLRQKFGTDKFRISPKPASDGSVEVSLGEEFIGVIYRDDDEGEVSYHFQMAILDMDLPEV